MTDCEAFAALAADAWDLGIVPVFAGLAPHNGFEKEQDMLFNHSHALKSLNLQSPTCVPLCASSAVGRHL